MTRTPGKDLTRRTVLAGGLAVAGASLTGLPRRASAETALSLGDHQIMVFSDGHLTLPMNFILPDRSEAEIAALLEPHGLATDVLTPNCNITLLKSGDRLVLFDVGSGTNFQPTAGELPAKLEAAGIDPSNITDVVLTHAHPDHLWGILDDFDDPLYPEASIWVPEAEWDYWRADDTLANMPEERKSFVVGAQARFEAIEDQVSMIRPGQEMLPGVEAVDTAGHTPGHMSYVIHGGGDSVMVVGDAITNTVISFEKPGWASGSDQDRDMGIATRMALLDRLAQENTRLIGYHFPHPGNGRVEKAGVTYRFVAG
ncbi:MBL fold metallo-hydrolase [Roseibium sediminicola]|uniref:MBL fold metallo-hydrolase n=1 Tax=Roseibium sediminicola TaxID=2933272 RepID=A0ABT0H0Y7_9HYPH|nr:MBL fold metallo-hydrolase [Roseibium sp. CAU 1639]MCK7615352.1 MBL fold metallo-hydrolase [Roseibium sp. CAU 1639]